MINKSKLLNIIDYTRRKTENETKFLGGNAITLLNYLNEDLRNYDFSLSVLSGADLSNCDLSATCFRKAIMRNVKLSGSILKFADFSGADLNGVILETTSKFIYFSWSPDGKYFATIEDEGIIRIWDASTYRQVKILNSQDNPKCLSWSKKYPLLACGNSNGSINIWNVDDCKLYAKINFRENSISAITFYEDRLICGDLRGHIAVYDLKSKREIQHIERKEKINKFVYVDSLGYMVISNIDGLEILNANDLHTISFIGKNETPFYVNEKDEKVIYTEFDPKLPDWNERDSYLNKLCAKKITSSDSDVENIFTWFCGFSIHEDPEDDFEDYIRNEEYEVIDICGNTLDDGFSLILYKYYYRYDYDAYYSVDAADIYTLFIVNENKIVKRIDLGYNGSHSEYSSERKGISNDYSNLCYSYDGRRIGYLDKGEIKIIDTDQTKDSFGELVKVIKRSLNCEGINIDNTVGLNEKQIEIIKNS